MDKFTLNKEDVVLLIIDIQDKLVKAMNEGERTIENTKILCRGANEMNIPIIITEQYPKGLGNTIAEIKELTADVDVFEKNSFSGIEEIKAKLKELGRRKVILVGMETHVCVFQTARDLIASDYGVYIVRDAVASRTKENCLNGLGLIRDMGGVISNTETVVFDLLKSSKAPEFKTMSKLIK